MEKVKLKDICRLINGRAYKQDELLDSGKYPVLRVGNFFSDKDFYYSDLELEDDKYCDNGDLLFAWSASFGPKIWDGEKVIYHYHIWKMELTDRVHKEYLYYYLFYLSERIKSEGHGGIMIHTTKSEMEEREFYLPSLDEQIYVSEVIRKVEGIIYKRKEELQQLDDLIKARFVEMFGHQSHNEKGLSYETIDDVADIYLGITHTPNYVDSGVMFISAKNTSRDFLDLCDVKYISREEFETAPKGAKPLKGDVLFSRVGSNLGHPVILEDDIELCTFVSLGFLRTKGRVTNNYLKHWMRDDFFAEQVSSHVKGGGQPNLNTGWLKEFKIIVPDIEAQIAFDGFCDRVDKSKVVYPLTVF